MKNRRGKYGSPKGGLESDRSSLPSQRRKKSSRVGWRPLTFFIGFSFLVAFVTLSCRTKPKSHQVDSFAPTTRHPSRRFPRFGTAAFLQQCGWTTKQSSLDRSCVVFLRPSSNDYEGIANWVAKAVSGFIDAKLNGCAFIMDYGASVDIHQIIIPHDGDSMNNWTVPAGFTTCSDATKCWNATFTDQLKRKNPAKQKRPFLPHYRTVFKESPLLHMYRKNLQHIERGLPGFALRTGMACAFESLLELSEEASEFEPHLFTHILPTLRDERNLVIAIYIRTDHADRTARMERNLNSINHDAMLEDEKWNRMFVQNDLPCILNVERTYLSNSSETTSFSRVVWTVVSDSPALKAMMTASYASTSANGGAGSAANGIAIPREIVTTASRGVHTRAARSPSTADFAQGMIDWYLIGESDVVVLGDARAQTFGSTGALRTARPVRDAASSCSEATPSIHEEEEPPLWEDAMKAWTSRNVRVVTAS